MGGNMLGNQIGQGLMRQKMQQNPMPEGQQGPPSPFSMIPEMRFDPDKGLNITLSPEHLQQLIGGLIPQGPPQLQGQPPILPPQQRMM